MKNLFFFLLLAAIFVSCKRDFMCYCEAEVTVEDVTTIHKYEQSVTAYSRKEGKNKCQKYAYNTRYSKISCELYDY